MYVEPPEYFSSRCRTMKALPPNFLRCRIMHYLPPLRCQIMRPLSLFFNNAFYMRPHLYYIISRKDDKIFIGYIAFCFWQWKWYTRYSNSLCRGQTSLGIHKRFYPFSNILFKLGLVRWCHNPIVLRFFCWTSCCWYRCCRCCYC